MSMRHRGVGVLGGGAWGLALAQAIQRKNGKVILHTRRRVNIPSVAVTESYEELARAGLLIVAVPSAVAREVFHELGNHLDGAHLVVHGVRGLGPHLETVSDLLKEQTAARRIGALGGPVQASELQEGRRSTMVCASQFPEVSRAVKDAFESQSLKVYTSHDLRGLEWASALVGCLAVGVGFAQGGGAGPGLIAALITEAVHEAGRLAALVGADEKTMLGLGGYGDLLASIALAERPEVMLGRALASGKSLREAMEAATLHVEAVTLIPRIADFANDKGVKAPVFEALRDALLGASPEATIEKLF